MSLLEVKDLRKYFPVRKLGKREYIKAVDGVSFSMEAGEIFGILGESGCGKSTLGMLIARLERETSGEIIFDGKIISGSLKLPKELRREIQIIFQNPYDSFDPRFTIQETLLTPLRIHGIGSSDKERLEIIEDFMNRAGFDPPGSYLRRYPHELSGGQLQRVSIIRAMMLKPKLLIADECVSMLDVSVRAEVINLLMDLVESSGTAMIFITHDISLGRYVSDRIAVMYLGEIVEIGKSDDIVENPIHPYTKILVSYSPSLLKRRKERIRPKRGISTKDMYVAGCKFAPRCPFSIEDCYVRRPQMVKLNDGRVVNCHLIRKEART